MGVSRYISIKLGYLYNKYRHIRTITKNSVCHLCIIPGGRDDSVGNSLDKENFAKLLRELRTSFNNVNSEKPLLLTAAVSAGKSTIDKAYDVEAMEQNLDFINVMTYDYHGWLDFFCTPYPLLYNWRMYSLLSVAH